MGIPVVTAKQMKFLETYAEDVWGLKPILLMENAGVGASLSLVDLHIDGSVCIVVGPGNNGGDGCVIARHLLLRQLPVTLVVVGGSQPKSVDAQYCFQIAVNMGAQVFSVTSQSELPAVAGILSASDWVVDALLGTGLTRPITGLYQQVVETINELHDLIGYRLVCLDVPSGLDSDEGKVLGVAVKADITLTLGWPKRSCFLGDGPDVVGQLRHVSLPLPSPRDVTWQDEARWLDIIGPDDIVLPRAQARDVHKGDFGHCLVVAGCSEMSGAARLAIEGCMRVGAGLVTGGFPRSSHDLIKSSGVAEMMSVALADDCGGLGRKAIPQLPSLVSGKDVVLLGPGLQPYDQLTDFVTALFNSAPDVSFVLDAQVFNAFGGTLTAKLSQYLSRCVLTPHPGELARLMETSTSWVQANRALAVSSFAKQSQAIVVLKGFNTLVAGPDGPIWMNVAGNAAMATAGMGDVLAGMIAGLLAQGLEPLQAAKTGVYIHALAADSLVVDSCTRGLLASDIPRAIVQVMRKLNQKHGNTD